MARLQDWSEDAACRTGDSDALFADGPGQSRPLFQHGRHERVHDQTGPWKAQAGVLAVRPGDNLVPVDERGGFVVGTQQGG
ncbi:hypothetical protein [Streptomyces sp. NBC_00198]|uniref:hypothetical protein n=1 Tax=Streptomyces sp. NBC_00198 TaxID=2975677 RepID=UPI002252EAD0|nr:hypothetical protein [Streptomyces sp. NBC_00198]MCX5285575.1 hypothetical protein [Streptomyces sp. NBC_00198]